MGQPCSPAPHRPHTPPTTELTVPAGGTHTAKCHRSDCSSVPLASKRGKVPRAESNPQRPPGRTLPTALHCVGSTRSGSETHRAHRGSSDTHCAHAEHTWQAEATSCPASHQQLSPTAFRAGAEGASGRRRSRAHRPPAFSPLQHQSELHPRDGESVGRDAAVGLGDGTRGRGGSPVSPSAIPTATRPRRHRRRRPPRPGQRLSAPTAPTVRSLPVRAERARAKPVPLAEGQRCRPRLCPRRSRPSRSLEHPPPPPPPPPTPGTARPLAGSAVNRWWVGGARCDAGGRPGGAGKGNGHPGAAAPMSGGVPAWSRVPAPPAPLLPGRDPHSQRQKTSVSIAMALPLPADLPSPNSPPSPRRGLGSACSPEPWGHPKSLRGSYPRRRGQRNGLYADTNICSCVYTARLQGSITPGAGEPDPLGPPGPNAPSLRRVVPVCGAGSPPEATRSGGEQRGMGTAGNTAKDGAVPPPRGSRPLPVPHRRGMQRAAASPSGAGGAVPTAEPPYGVTPRNAPFSRARSPPLAAAAGMGAPRVTATPSGSLSLHPSTPQPPGTSWDKDRNVEKRRPGPSAPDPRGARRPSVLQRTEIRRAADAASRHAAG